MQEGDVVALTGPDDPGGYVWEGRPGVVIAVLRGAGGEPLDVAVSLVGGGALSGVPDLCVGIDRETYISRGRRIVAGLHPVRDEPIGPNLTAPGHEWP